MMRIAWIEKTIPVITIGDQMPEPIEEMEMRQVIGASVRVDNCQSLADRYCDISGMATWVVWNCTKYPNDGLCVIDQSQLNCLSLNSEGDCRLVYCSDRPGEWLVTPDDMIRLWKEQA